MAHSTVSPCNNNRMTINMNWTVQKTLDINSAIKYYCKIQTMNYNDNVIGISTTAQHTSFIVKWNGKQWNDNRPKIFFEFNAMTMQWMNIILGLDAQFCNFIDYISNLVFVSTIRNHCLSQSNWRQLVFVWIHVQCTQCTNIHKSTCFKNYYPKQL